MIGYVLAAAIGYGARFLYDKIVAGKIQSLMAPLPGSQPTALVTVLEPGRAYVADMLLDSAQFKTSDPQNEAQGIVDAMTPIGFAFMGSPPEPRDPTQTHLFQTKQPARFFYIFHWQGQAGAPGALPGFVKQVNFYDVPGSV
jgi:hypothetical protein